MKIDHIMQIACPSIQYRIQMEIMGESATSQGMLDLQNKILSDPVVQKIFSWQQPDGWLGYSFHGENGMETCIRLLCEKGVEKSHPVILKALKILEKDDKRLSIGIGKAGNILDEYNLGGTQMIRAVVIAYTGVEDCNLVQDQIQKAMDCFQTISSIQSIKDIVTSYIGKLVYKPQIIWPSIYHLRLLAFTQSWRNKENYKILTDGIQRLVQLSPIPYVLLKHKSQLIAPASFCMLDFNPEISKLDNSGWMMWFHRMEILARLGVVKMVSELDQQVEILKSILEQNQGKFVKKLSHTYFRKWGAYSGLMLEKDWRDQNRRISDLTFRSLLILHYSNYLNLS